MQQEQQMNAGSWIALIVLAALWGASFLFGRIAVLEVPPFTVVFFRVGIAALCLWLFILVTGRKFHLSAQLAGATAIMGILNNVLPFSFILYGQKEIGAGLASVVNAMTPIWTLLIANWLTSDEKFSTRKLIGIMSGFFGVAVLMGGDIWLGLTASALAQASVLAATVSYGFAGVWGKRFRDYDPVLVAACQLSASTLFMIPLVLMIDDPFAITMPSAKVIWSIIGIAVLCTAIAYILFFRILSQAGAVNVSLVTFLVPVSAILLGILVLDETLALHHFGGIGLIALGLIILDGRLLHRQKMQ